MICPAAMFVSGTSAVGMSQRPSVVWNRSSANFGSCPVPNIVASFTRLGTDISV